ncbi:DUF6518 family protein [Streptomyces sp. AS58]|uniref:DUF6518 family protein n=1 Tax=Streptomyces sp. AS58 TaxID=1519489 RepID=UPI0007C77104|nr:DUF6518 family protein [Streptomyces sp. AS58]
MATTTPTALSVPRSPALPAAGWGLAAGLALGVLTNLAQGWLPGHSNQTANSGAVWSAAAFAVGAVSAGRVSLLVAAVTGLLTEVGLVIGYYGYAEFGRDGMGSLEWPLVWLFAACVAGPLFGVAGVWSRAGGSRTLRIVGTAAFAGVCGGEAIHYARALNYWIEAAGLILVLLLVSLLLPRTMKDRALTLSVAAVFSVVSYVGVTTTGNVFKPEPTIGSVRGLTAAELRATVVAMVPSGFEVTAQGGQNGESAYVVVTDGKSSSRVDVNVQTGMSWAKDQLFGRSTRLSDGTLLATSKQTDSASGLVTWSADTLREGGLRVAVTAYNAEDIDRPAAGTTPVLTVEQLTAMATDEEWAQLS